MTWESIGNFHQGINVMSHLKSYAVIMLILLLNLPTGLVSTADSQGAKSKSAKSANASEPDYPSMPNPGKKVTLMNGYYMVYGFDKKPKIGVVIMKVEIFNPEGQKDTAFEMKAHADMPSMKGAHVIVDRAFRTSKKGDYLVPLDIVMPGDWEIRLTVLKNGKVIFRGRYNFDV
ncbi:MAG: hypothetical protein CSYNP_04243 [Syntrophus sp. SKADARSKE-3]|nr:hypothetical protein [Syntrophus sp. SKADARSKE-3]